MPTAEGENGPAARDEALLAAARAGDDGAFHDLVDAHAERLFRLAFSLVGSAADAEDVVQETLLGAFRHMRRFEGRSTVKTWLTRILLRQAARHHRRRGRRAEQPLTAAGRTDGARGAGPEHVARRLDVQAALERLSPLHREVLVLREFGGMSYAEMAEALDVPQGTVESRLHRARREMRELLRDYLP
jgi:RNA polymerase sigma-70 factor (ECF subfamily)